MGCGSSTSSRNFPRNGTRTQHDKVVTFHERGEPEGEAGTEKGNKEKITPKSAEKAETSGLRSMTYVPLDDCRISCPDTDMSVSEVSESSIA